MKKIYIVFTQLVLCFLLIACNKDLTSWENSECYLNFVYYDYTGEVVEAEKVTDEMRTSSYSFVYAGENTVIDTLWFEVSTMGFLSEEERPLALEQIVVEGEDNAIPGVHYMAFDDVKLAKFFCVPGNQNVVNIPVVLIRDASLKEKNVILKFGFKDNGVFKKGYDGLDFRFVYITDQLAEPENWNKYIRDGLGNWGKKKHQLMIDWTGKKWDEDYIESFALGDNAYVNYMYQWFKQKLAEENAKRLERGEDVYKEEDGTPVDFTPIY